MARKKPVRYGDREDDSQVDLTEVADEEAQLLDGEDYEQFELDDAARPVHRQHPPPQNRPRSSGLLTRRRSPRWLAFLYGPDPPKMQTIKPLFPSVQELPVRWLEKTLPQRWQRVVLLVVFLLAWAASLAVPLVLSKGTATDASGAAIRHIDCVDTLWKRNNECGLDGVDCRPFSNTSFAFRCPADCAGVRVLNPHHVGPLDVNFRPLVIGGGGQAPYRGDSFLCGAAIHAGVVDDATGGCGVATLTGEYYQYFASSQHGIDSIPFDSHFPLSFTVAADPSIRCTSPDPRWAVSLPLSLLFSASLSLLTTSASLFFSTTFLGIFTHVALVSDPPNLSAPSSATFLPALVSSYLAHLLPAAFVAAILYRFTVRTTLANLPASANGAKTLYWLGAFWLGALSNRAIEPLIPVARLTGGVDELTAQRGAVAALAVVVGIGVVLVTAQARTLFLEGRLPRYLALGFASVVETAEALRNDGGFGGALLPEVVPPLIERLGWGPDGMRISFKWRALMARAVVGGLPVEGISVLVNDVERYRGWFAERPLEQHVFSWARRAGRVMADEYFRFGFVTERGRALDYTEAGTWYVNGSWSQGAGYW
ncbi:hypothetical protein N658DRAFT_489719 [Parathielavia hyrcaniae]|uniref:LCCL domain-containing protein n=1 Tax=Parathielavia hyrcaniae TaxID=113614 RepID=A0AAN6SXA4_9PEZI|nr:hypothetical protein N658DRAFT_489719 [Parathielavia hyrcaniae]